MSSTSQPIINPFPNGTSLTSSKLTPDTLVDVLQPLLIQIVLGQNAPPSANPAFDFVRLGWEEEGETAPLFGNNYCALTAKPVNARYSQVRDAALCNSETSGQLNQNMTYVQRWAVNCNLWGPDCYANASLIISAMSIDWVLMYLQQLPNSPSKLFPLPHNERPVYGPELFQRRWWRRATMVLPFYELINETTTLPAAASIGITLDTDTGIVQPVTA